MVDQIPEVKTCRVCGEQITEGHLNSDRVCERCVAYQPGGEGQPTPAGFYGPDSAVAMLPRLDPDNPRWGPGTALSTWLFNVASLIVIPLIAILALYMIDRQQGLPVPDPADKEAMVAWALSPRVIFVNVLANIPAHLITIAFCWAVVTRIRKQPFLPSLGWHWGGRSPLYWAGVSIAIVIGLVLVANLLSKLVPQAKTPFDDLLNVSREVKLAVAFMATFSAPFVEELVYRGVVYSGLRKVMNTTATIAVVTLLFAGVHLLQYQGAWVTLISLVMLSFVITLIRAKTKSILPCVAVHFINNGLMSLLIVFGVDS
jgi:membrane protease YdiL (CAAX protease family)